MGQVAHSRRMIKPFSAFLLLFLAIVINFQGNSKTYLAKTSDERKTSQDYSRTSIPLYKQPYLYGTKYSGHIYRTLYGVGSARECACKCRYQRSGCSLFTFYNAPRSTARNACHMMSYDVKLTKNARYTSGHFLLADIGCNIVYG